MTIEFLEHCKKNFIHLILRTPNCSTIEQFEDLFNFWMLKNANWNKPSDIFRTFGSADLLGNACSRVVFNIGGNEFRMICKYQITKTEMRLYIKWIGTHEQYNALCKLNQQYTIDLYKK